MRRTTDHIHHRYIGVELIIMGLMLLACSGHASTVAKTPVGSSSSILSVSSSPTSSRSEESINEQSSSASASISSAEGFPSSLPPSSILPVPQNRCAIQFSSPEIMQAVLSLPPDPRSKQPWNPEPIASNYNECTDLSAIIVKANTNSAHPATRALLFHLGHYLNTATPDTYGFDGIVLNQCTPQTVTLRNSSGIAGLSGIVQFRWNGTGVDVVTNSTHKKKHH